MDESKVPHFLAHPLHSFVLIVFPVSPKSSNSKIHVRGKALHGCQAIRLPE